MHIQKIKIRSSYYFITKLILFFLTPGFLLGYEGPESITNPQRDDGFGAQFLTTMLAAMYAELHNIPFYYTPFIRMEHNYDNDPDFLKKKEELINFIGNFPINQDNQAGKIGVGTLLFFFEHRAELFSRTQTLQKIKQIFRVNKNRNDYFDDEHFHIAVHIRRSNPHDGRLGGTDMPDSVHLKIIDKLRATHASQKPLFHIYSQGDLTAFKSIYEANDVIFHLNESIEDTFTAMVFADALATTCSTFSYTAGFLSDGLVYYIRFDHPKFPNWVDSYQLISQ